MNGKKLLLVVTAMLIGHSAFSKEEELMKLLPEKQHAGADFLISNMPKRDAAALSAKFLAENIDYAYRAKSTFPWAADISDDLFLNYVLPYANLDENRDPWRKQFFEKFGDTVAGCKTSGEAAIKLNTTIYEVLNVHYSKQRPKANQSPAESISSGKASCTGLSILLANACRAVGIPARVVGTPRWVKGGGNHTWVEVWDDGWHRIGAAESKALDKTWFDKKTAEQVGHGAKHAIYAASFKKTALYFPLVWSPSAKYVNAQDVTAHYATKNHGIASKGAAKKALGEKPLVDLITDLKNQDILISQKDYAGFKKLIWQKYADEIKADEKRCKEHEQKFVSYDGMTMRYAYKIVGDKPKDGYSLYIAMHGGGGTQARVNDSQWLQMQTYYLDGVTNGIYLAPRGVNNEWNLHWSRQSYVCYDRIIENMIVYEGVDPNRIYLMGFSAGGDAAYQIPARMPDRWAAVAMSAGHPNDVPIDNYANLAFLIQVGERDQSYKRNTVAAEYGVKIAKLEKAHPGLYKNATYIHAGRFHGFMDHGEQGAKQKVFTDPASWLEKGSRAETSGVDCHSIRWLDRHVREPLPKKVIWDCKTRCERSGKDGFRPMTEKGNLHYWLGLDRYDKDIELVSERIVVELDSEKNRLDVKEIGNYVRFYLNPDLVDLEKEITVTVEGKTMRIRPKLSLEVMVRSMLDRGDPNYIFPVCLTLSKNPEGTWILE